jgi:hypothetical protein
LCNMRSTDEKLTKPTNISPPAGMQVFFVSLASLI